MTLDDLPQLPPTLGAPETAEIWGICTDHVYELARRGECPVAPLHLGRKLRWSTVKVLESVGITYTSELA